MIEITRTIAEDNNAFWVAEHALDGGAALIMVGALPEVVSPSNVTNVMWVELTKQVSHVGRTLTTRLHGPFATRAVADAAAAVLGMTRPPYCTGPMKPDRSSRQVVCRETGRIFKSSYAAAKFFDLDPSAVNRHLRKVTGFKTVKGREFVYYDELPADQQNTVDQMNAALENQ